MKGEPVIEARAVEESQGMNRSSVSAAEKEQVAAWRANLPDEMQGLCDSIFLNDLAKEKSVQDDLLQGEEIIADYNVFIPGNMWKLWLWWLLAILTCGVFVIYYYVELWCVRNKCCTRNSIQMESGRMVVTSFGRILIWKTEAYQQKTKEGGWCAALCKCIYCMPFLLIAKCIRCCKCCCVDECAPPVTYASLTDAMAFRVSQVRDIKMQVGVQLPFLMNICCCSEKYEAFVRVYFDAYSEDLNPGKVLQTIPGAKGEEAFITEVSSLFTKGFIAPLSSLFGSVPGVTGNDLAYVEIVSLREDEELYDRDHKSYDMAYSNMMEIQREINGIAAKAATKVWESPSSPTFVDDIVVEPPFDHPKSEFGDLSMIREHSCAAPSEMIVLAPGEEIISTSSSMYVLTCIDKLKYCFAILLCILCLPCIGLPILLDLREKRLSRTGLIMTTHRLIEVVLKRDEGSCWSMFIPASVLCCCPTTKVSCVRSIYPSSIQCGFNVFDLKAGVLEASLKSKAGKIKVHFGLKFFAQDTINVDAAANSVFKKRQNFVKALGAVVNKKPAINSPAENATWGKNDLMLLPKAKNEKLLARYNGEVPEDCCNPCCTIERSYYPGAVITCCCGIKPLIGKETLLVSDSGAYCVKSFGNDPWGCLKMCFYKNAAILFWSPVTDLSGHDVCSLQVGVENFFTRYCYGTSCGNNCCPKIKSAATVGIKVGEVTLNASTISPYEPLRSKPEVPAFRKDLSKIESCLSNTSQTFDIEGGTKL